MMGDSGGYRARKPSSLLRKPQIAKLIAEAEATRLVASSTVAEDHGLFGVHDTGQTATVRDASADCSTDSSRRRRSSRPLNRGCTAADAACTVAGSGPVGSVGMPGLVTS